MERWAAWMRRYAKILPWGIAALSALGLALYAPFAGAKEAVVQLSWPIRLLLGLAAGWLAAWLSLPKLTGRQLRYAFWTALPLALCCVTGMELQTQGTLRLTASALTQNAACWLGLSCLAAAALALLLQRGGGWLARLNRSRWGSFWERVFPAERRMAEKNVTTRDAVDATDGAALKPSRPGYRLLWLGWLFLLLCWLPVWLAYFPALGNYDLASHVAQCVQNQYNTMHPLLYTLFVKGCMLLGGENHELAIGLLAAFQMVCMSGCFAWAIASLRRLGAKAWLCVLAMAWFGLFPVFPLMAISTTKDVLFSGLALLVAVELYAMLREPERFCGSVWRQLRFLLTGLGMGLLRYNGVVSLAVYTLAFLLLWGQSEKKRSKPSKSGGEEGGHSVSGTAKHPRRGRLRWRLSVLLAAVLALTWAVTQGLNAITDASPSFVTMRDMASLPSQQLIRVAQSTADPEEYREIMHWYGDETVTSRYRPRLADYTKRYIDVGHDNGWRGYYETWLRVGLRHPQAYLEAFLELNRGLWFPDDLSHANIYVTKNARFGYLTNNQAGCREEGYPIVYQSLLPGLKSALNKLTAANEYLTLPGLRWLFSIGAQSWLAMLAFVAACYRRDRAAKWCALWPLLLLAVLVAAPCVLVRYALPVFCCNPILVLALCRKRDEQSPKDQKNQG